LSASRLSAEIFSAPARQSAALTETEHRPWPLPGGSWILGQSWEDLFFAHWRVDADEVRKLVPPGLGVDQHDGSAWLGVTPFEIAGFRFRGTLPFPVVSRFPEINVRTYVTAEDKPGIWFFSLDTSSLLAVEAARRAYKLPYFHSRISLERRGSRVWYAAARRNAPRPFVFEASYRPAGEAGEPEPGSLEHFLTERYCLYAAEGQVLHRAEIHHPPWRIGRVEAAIEENTMAPDPLELQGEPLLHLAERQDVVIWPLELLAARK
jgi:uncharacterized protein YqjF (DUF2071 family)